MATSCLVEALEFSIEKIKFFLLKDMLSVFFISHIIVPSHIFLKKTNEKIFTCLGDSCNANGLQQV